jgi:hypothetical protein
MRMPHSPLAFGSVLELLNFSSSRPLLAPGGLGISMCYALAFGWVPSPPFGYFLFNSFLFS